MTVEQMVSQVPELTTLTGFGFSLDGKVDVDDNGYRGELCRQLRINIASFIIIMLRVDLVIGAVGNATGQAVFVLRCTIH